MSKLLNKILIASLLFLIISCNNITKSIENGFFKNEIKPFVNTWIMKSSQYPFSSKFIFYHNFSFRYEFSSLSNRFSEGYWKLDSGIIVLNSLKLDSCMYFSRFGEECIRIDNFIEVDKKLLATTLDNCFPNSQDVYVFFERDSFYFSNGTLYYKKNIDNICPIKHNYTAFK